MLGCAAALFVCLAACGGEEAAPANGTTPEPAAEAPPSDEPTAEAEAPAGPSATGDSFELAASPASAPYAAGGASTFAIRLVGRNGWHVNTEYPISVSLSGDGITFPASSLDQSAAAAYEEAEARFEVPFSAPSGEHVARAEVSFAMCNPANCIMERQTLALPLAVQ